MGNLTRIADCRDDAFIDELFGSVSEFARQVEINGQEFNYAGIRVTYDAQLDIHTFWATER